MANGSCHPRIEDERQPAGQKVGLPDILWNGGEGRTGVHAKPICKAIVDLHPWTPVVHECFVNWLQD